MAKKSKSSGKGESKASGEDDTLSSIPEMKIPKPEGGIIEFYLLFGGLGIIMAIIMIMYLLNQYVFQIL